MRKGVWSEINPDTFFVVDNSDIMCYNDEDFSQ